MTFQKRSFLAVVAAVVLAWSGLTLARGHIESLDLLSRIQPGVTTPAEVEQILGQPGTVMKFRDGTQTMEYEARDLGTLVRISITIGRDGKVRDIRRFTATGP